MQIIMYINLKTLNNKNNKNVKINLYQLCPNNKHQQLSHSWSRLYSHSAKQEVSTMCPIYHHLYCINDNKYAQSAPCQQLLYLMLI